MQLSQRHKKNLLLAILSLLLGYLNYLLFQPHIAFFDFISIAPAKPYFIQNKLLRNFMTGHFSDIAWCCSLYLVTALLTELNYLYVSGKILILLLPFILEIAQYFHIVGGRFDWFDLLSYLIILLLFFKLFPALKFKRNEK
jgi:hypothetical protein